jgi:hypothetical protein
LRLARRRKVMPRVVSICLPHAMNAGKVIDLACFAASVGAGTLHGKYIWAA